MLLDFFTKTLGDSLFITIQDICQGLLPLSELQTRHQLKLDQETKTINSSLSVLKECVEDNIKDGEYKNSELKIENTKQMNNNNMVVCKQHCMEVQHKNKDTNKTTEKIY